MPDGFDNLPQWLMEFRETFTDIYQFIVKDVTKDTNEWCDREGHGAMSGRVPDTGASLSSK